MDLLMCGQLRDPDDVAKSAKGNVCQEGVGESISEGEGDLQETHIHICIYVFERIKGSL